MSPASAAPLSDAPADLLAQFRAAAAEDLRMLAALHAAEPGQELLQSLRDAGFPDGLGVNLGSVVGREALAGLRDALRALPDPPTRRALDALAVDYASIYLTYAIHASPCESVWTDEEGLARQQSMFQVREWYRRYAVAVPDWRKREDDHLVPQLQFVAHLLDLRGSPDTLAEAARFMDEHLLRWVTRFARRTAERCATPFFAAATLLTAAYCEELRDLLAQVLGQPRPRPEEIEERMRPKRRAEPVPVAFMPGIGPSW